MKRQRKTRGEHETLGAQKKLERLLSTESELEAMLAQARLEATQIVEAARKDADERIRRFESALESEARALRAGVERERDETLESIRREAEAQVARFEQLSETSLDSLASHVLSLLLDASEQAGAS